MVEPGFVFESSVPLTPLRPGTFDPSETEDVRTTQRSPSTQEAVEFVQEINRTGSVRTVFNDTTIDFDAPQTVRITDRDSNGGLPMITGALMAPVGALIPKGTVTVLSKQEIFTPDTLPMDFTQGFIGAADLEARLIPLTTLERTLSFFGADDPRQVAKALKTATGLVAVAALGLIIGLPIARGLGRRAGRAAGGTK